MNLKFINILTILLSSFIIFISCDDKAEEIVKTDGISWNVNGDWFNVSRYPILINSQYGRYSEGAFIQLNDNRVMAVYTRFDKEHEDHTPASIVSRISPDRGESWSEEKIIVHNTDDILNVMSASLIRLNNGVIGLIYLVKETIVNCYPVIRFSNDNGNTFSEAINIIESGEGYFTVNNSRAIMLNSGRILVPVSEFDNDGEQLTSYKGKIFYMFSDDNGMTWHKSAYLKQSTNDVALQEPGIVELKDRSLLCYARSDKGSQFFSKSYDGGLSWTELDESSLISPVSPATIIQTNNGLKPLIAIFNNSTEERKPLTLALSYDDGETWGGKSLNICILYSSYPSIFVYDDGEILVSYCWSSSLPSGLENFSIDKFRYIENHTDSLCTRIL